MAPDITVLLPVYNGEKFIAEAVTSILDQSYANFELLVMDDGSTDGTPQVLEVLAAADARVRIHRRENRGLITTLNEGLAMCSTELVARMDADDRAMPERLQLQKTFMDRHAHIAVCGTGMEMYESGRVVKPRCGAPFDIMCLFGSPLAHPTVMYRRSVVLGLGGYAADMPAGEDYDLWCRIAAAGYGMDNLPQALLRYREHPQMPRIVYRRQSAKTTQAVWVRQLEALGLSPSYADLDSHAYCAAPCADIGLRERAAARWLAKLCAANAARPIYDQGMLERECSAMAAAFPPAVRLLGAPRAWLKRLLRYCCVSLVQRLGKYGEKVEDTLRGLSLYVAAWGKR